MMFSGFYVRLSEILPILWPFQWISVMKYTFNILLRNEFIGNDKIDVRVNGVRQDPKDIIEDIGANIDIWVAFLCLIGLYILFLGISLLLLTINTKRL